MFYWVCCRPSHDVHCRLPRTVIEDKTSHPRESSSVQPSLYLRRSGFLREGPNQTVVAIGVGVSPSHDRDRVDRVSRTRPDVSPRAQSPVGTDPRRGPTTDLPDPLRVHKCPCTRTGVGGPPRPGLTGPRIPTLGLSEPPPDETLRDNPRHGDVVKSPR